MKKKQKIILITSIVILGVVSVFAVISLQPKAKGQIPEVIDLSNTTLPSYKLPSDAKITKEEMIEKLSQRLERCKEGKELWDWRFPDGPIPTRIQVVTLHYEEFTRIFLNNKSASMLIPKEKLFILVVIDIEKPFRQAVANMSVPSEQMELWEKKGLLESNEPFIYQEYQLIDPETGAVTEWGYNKNIVILPKQVN